MAPVNTGLCLVVVIISLFRERLPVANLNASVNHFYATGDPLGLLLQPMFVDYSRFCRVVSFHRNDHMFFLFLLLLIWRCSF